LEDINEITAEFPPKILDTIFRSSRYKIYHGGRGGGKSWNIARALLIQAVENPLRILCTREFMSSMQDSVHRLLCDQISNLGLQQFYTIGKASISGQNGSEFRFAGIKTNPEAIKSFEGIDIAFVEEAANVSKHSWDILIPTIRNPNSEIWVSFNPELESDATWKMFVDNPRPNSIIVQLNYNDNPFFPEVLRQEMEYLKQLDYNSYENIWLGRPKQFLEGAIYSSELKAASETHRITNVPYDQSAAVHVFFDLGWRDSTSMIFAQIVNRQYRIIDFYENSGEKIQHYINIIQNKGYILGTVYLPHDSVKDSMISERSVEATMRQVGGFGVQVLPKSSIEDGIQAARTIFPNCWFDEEKCLDLITYLRKYRYDDVHTSSNKPLHDENSHASDAFRYLAMGLKEPRTKFNYDRFKGASMSTGLKTSYSWMKK
jgi:phage terminase large subunit